jgi:glutamate-1-semialdehyde 2,1-aminomutase
MQEMLKNKVLIPWISIAYRHQTKEFDITMEAIENSLNIYKKALKNGVKRYLKGPPVKPVFRRYN